eukprot:scpid106925/ scgid1147/ Probable glycerol kinase; ATP:glycerol 3-phosphotransferase
MASTEAAILAIDQGTSSSRTLVFDARTGECLASAQRVVNKYEPCAGWVEQDAMELFSTVEECLSEILPKLSVSSIKAVGITNQRETTVLWDKSTGQPLYNAIAQEPIKSSFQDSFR